MAGSSANLLLASPGLLSLNSPSDPDLLYHTGSDTRRGQIRHPHEVIVHYFYISLPTSFEQLNLELSK